MCTDISAMSTNTNHTPHSNAALRTAPIIHRRTDPTTHSPTLCCNNHTEKCIYLPNACAHICVPEVVRLMQHMAKTGGRRRGEYRIVGVRARAQCLKYVYVTQVGNTIVFECNLHLHFNLKNAYQFY